jgi:hypothetical protein
MESVQAATGPPLMAKPTERKQIGGEAVHIGDCQVWAEIYLIRRRTIVNTFRKTARALVPVTTSSGWILRDLRLDQFPSECGVGWRPHFFS